jgi:BirA family transcriptional regulator, biotin operon repressor / biotin---[acetyl-CoA-carboxylase] ligase
VGCQGTSVAGVPQSGDGDWLAKVVNSRVLSVAPWLLDTDGMMATVSDRVNEHAGLAEDALCIDLIRRELSTASIGFEIRLFSKLSSTVEALRVLAESGAREGTAVLAETQPAGRGWFGKPWFPPERANLYGAVLFRPRIPRHSVGVFGCIAALALTDAITAEGARAHVRWPNEVLLDGRRLGSTLTTIEPADAIAEYVIVGVEVNLNVSREVLGRALGVSAALVTSLREAVGHPIDRNRFTAAFLNHLERWLGIYRARGAGAILRAWNELDVLRGHVVEVRAADTSQRGRVAGVDDEGRLVLEGSRGAERAIATGEIVAVD